MRRLSDDNQRHDRSRVRLAPDREPRHFGELPARAVVRQEPPSGAMAKVTGHDLRSFAIQPARLPIQRVAISEEAAWAALTEQGVGFTAANTEILLPWDLQWGNLNCHQFTLWAGQALAKLQALSEQQTPTATNFDRDGADVLAAGRAGARVALFYKGGQIGHSARIMPNGKLQHLFNGVGVLESNIRPDDPLTYYDRRINLPADKEDPAVRVVEESGALIEHANEASGRGDEELGDAFEELSTDIKKGPASIDGNAYTLRKNALLSRLQTLRDGSSGSGATAAEGKRDDEQ